MIYHVVINESYGGFNLSDKAIKYLAERGIDLEGENHPSVTQLPRHHPDLISCVKALGKDACGEYCNLVIVEVEGPYRIREYDGFESLEFPHSIQWSDPSKF